jgi:hypothetical protein
LASVLTAEQELTLDNVNSATAQIGKGSGQASSYAASGVASGAYTFDTTSPLDVQLAANLANAADVVTFMRISIEAIYGN